MAGHRLDRTNDDIRIVVSELLRGIKDPRVNQGMISVVRTETTSDLRYCTVYVSVYNLHGEREFNEKEFKKGIKSASGYLRHELGTKLDLRYTPELIFELDNSIEHGAHISRIMNEPGFLNPEAKAKTDEVDKH